MVIVTDSAPEPADGRPWPAPSTDTGWWGGETVGPSAVGSPVDSPADSDETDSDPPMVAQRRPAPSPGRRRVAGLVAATPGRTSAAEPDAEPAAEPAASPPTESKPARGPDDGFPLWPAIEKVAWPAPQLRLGRLPRRVSRAPKPRRAKAYRRPGTGLPALVLLALLAGFLAWVSADAFWVAMGHGHTGTATVTRCTGRGLDSRCTGTFAGAGFTARRVALAGLPAAAQRPGTAVPATMASARGRVAYARQVHDPRWALGFGLVLLCGLAIGWATGAGRLPGRRARIGAFAVSLAGPLLLLAGALAVTW
jgi:hypothetical protein